ncbi:MAG: exodeoxyribonuclease VII large subunit [Chlorobium sp.]|uniref:exodeoxyribonuclease VII large subunit n=1 Tax=Chlorobium sp. TaxID=1095 RepID=UPI0025C07BAF|nr:exodeoxyribonuclease VII large subunit [Chlorobium sp.]MCF8216100.1 exodeoxyribonuclease VII large subunit [Chlorobium sp.]MCF8271001.1 exodeoxyribonuclease VII large subunit [Chlorobium sp.]MCF8287353.1 exodeoxyribonuclease VII large subunit [Chlorobium sp.]MCF8290914.1 exodeoxyribonuclease VII large subunit [Chlorobium sp.]MCF8385009.1 exodeoxyribonuclease VII large subunit [Chlorobium sp.]
MSRNELSVSELTMQIKNELESLFPLVRVKGEISNFKRHSSGHSYLTLKDEQAQIPAVIWKNTGSRIGIKLQDGMEVIAEGRLEVYPPAGKYQLICSSITDAGKGQLQQTFALLLQKLAKAGYFNPERKRKLPPIPETIGIVTSPTGAVIEDMGKVIERRFPAVRMLLYPVKVQGGDAALDISRGINYFNNPADPQHKPDVLIIARGGGSMEDLQPFNEEIVADAIFRSSIPVISAIGHETDITIADMVADLRAGTPSIAAELAVPDRLDLIKTVENNQIRQNSSISSKLEGAQIETNSLINSYAFNRPLIQLQQITGKLDELPELLARSVKMKWTQNASAFAAANQHLALLDYRKTLERGYALVKKEGRFVTRSSKLKPADKTELIFHDGSVEVSVSGKPEH